MTQAHAINFSSWLFRPLPFLRYSDQAFLVIRVHFSRLIASTPNGELNEVPRRSPRRPSPSSTRSAPVSHPGQSLLRPAKRPLPPLPASCRASAPDHARDVHTHAQRLSLNCFVSLNPVSYGSCPASDEANGIHSAQGNELSGQRFTAFHSEPQRKGKSERLVGS